MRTRNGLVLTAFLLAAMASGCDRAESKEDEAAAQSEQRLILNQGYSMLYKDASSIGLAKLVLLAKLESDSFDDVVKQISAYGGELKDGLEQIEKNYPAVRLDLDPLPVMEQRKRNAIARDRVIHFLPFSGASQLEYERTMLISTSNALNHESHLCQAMADEEPNPELKKFLLDCEQRYAKLQQMVMGVLDREHFVADPDKQPKEESSEKTSRTNAPNASPGNRAR